MASDVRDRRISRIGADECQRLLAGGGVGRIGIATGSFPLVLPVDYRVDAAGVIVLRTAGGTAIDDADHANVSFEIDHVDPVDGSAWSVLVFGLAERVTDAHDTELVARTHGTGVTPSAPGERDRWFRIVPQAISGRRIHAARHGKGGAA